MPSSTSDSDERPPLEDFSYYAARPPSAGTSRLSGLPPGAARPAAEPRTVLADAGPNRLRLLIPVQTAAERSRRRPAGLVAELDAEYKGVGAAVDGILRRNARRMEALHARELERATERRTQTVRHAARHSERVVADARRAVEEGRGPADAAGGESLRGAEKSRLARALVDSYQLRTDPAGFSGRVCDRAAHPPGPPSPRAELRRTVSSYVSKQRALDMQLDGPRPRVGGEESAEKEDFLRMIMGV